MIGKGQHQVWVTTVLERVADWASGGTPSRANEAFFKGIIPWVKSGELGPKFICSTTEKITPEGIKRSAAKMFRKGSVGIAMYGATIGKLSIWGIDASANQACAVAMPIPELLFNEFLYYYLISQRRSLVEAGKGGAQPNISQAVLRNWPIPLPPLNEQRRIVAKIEELFSELDKGIENLKQARAQLGVYRQALLKHAFEGKLTAGWREKNAEKQIAAEELLSSVCVERDRLFKVEMEQWSRLVADEKQAATGEKLPPKPQKLKAAERKLPDYPKCIPASWLSFYLDQIALSIDQGWSPKCDEHPAIGGEWAVIRTTAIQKLKFQSHANKRLPEPLRPRPWLQIRADDILITRAGPRTRVGIVCRVKSCPEKIMLCDKAYRLRFPAQIVSAAFIEMLFNTTELASRIEKLKTGINDSGVNITQPGFLGLCITLPPLDEQVEIVTRVSQCLSIVSDLESDIDQNLQKAEAMRQAILKKAFAGELVPQDPKDEPATELLARIRAEREAIPKGLKARDVTAQAEGLGKRRKNVSSPERAAQNNRTSCA